MSFKDPLHICLVNIESCEYRVAALFHLAGPAVQIGKLGVSARARNLRFDAVARDATPRLIGRAPAH
jgi:hypothetical protein